MINLLTGNIRWKLFALIMAVPLWIAVANEPARRRQQLRDSQPHDDGKEDRQI